MAPLNVWLLKLVRGRHGTATVSSETLALSDSLGRQAEKFLAACVDLLEAHAIAPAEQSQAIGVVSAFQTVQVTSFAAASGYGSRDDLVALAESLSSRFGPPPQFEEFAARFRDLSGPTPGVRTGLAADLIRR